MWPYWILFLIPALMAVQRKPSPNLLRSTGWGAELWLYWCFLVLVIGLRNKVGADWDSYLRYLDTAADINFWQIVTIGDPGYIAVNWLSAQLGLGIVGVNLVSGAIFATGLINFSRTLSRPWLALTVAVPYMVIVVAMGYVRQGIALGLIMNGLAWLQRSNHLRFIAWALLAATFHKTAILITPFALAVWKLNHIVIAGILSIGLIYLIGQSPFFQNSVTYYISRYFDTGYAADGAFIRLLMNLFPGILFLAFIKSFNFSSVQKKIWMWMTALVVVFFFMLLLLPSSAAIDRIALYCLPLQLAVFSNLPEVLNTRFRLKKYDGVFAVILSYAVVQGTWLMLATHAAKWIPYDVVFH